MTELSKFWDYYQEWYFADENERGVFSYKKGYFFHAQFSHIIHSSDRGELDHAVSRYHARRDALVADNCVWLPFAEEKFLIDWQDHAIACGMRSVSDPLPTIDGAFNDAIKRTADKIEEYERDLVFVKQAIEAEQEEAA